MAENFTKLFGSITASTVWMEDSDTRIVWVTMLAMADGSGYVGASIPGLANVARVPVDKVRLAIAKFLAPDPDSRSKEHDGRRIEEVDRGWVLLNYERFRAIRDEDQRRERDRVRQERKRERDRQRDNVTAGHASSRDITLNHETPSASPSSGFTPSESGVLEAHPERAIPVLPSTAVVVHPKPALSGVSLAQLFGSIRAEVLGGLDWVAPRVSPEKAATMAATVEANGAADELRPSMRAFWAGVKSGNAPADAAKITRDGSFAFGCWANGFQAYVEQARGVAPKVRAGPTAAPDPYAKAPRFNAQGKVTSP